MNYRLDFRVYFKHRVGRFMHGVLASFLYHLVRPTYDLYLAIHDALLATCLKQTGFFCIKTDIVIHYNTCKQA